jgi:EF-hand domain pair/EF hand
MDFSDAVFALFDTDQSGFIDFREFVSGLSVMAANASAETAIEFAFHTFDESGDGRITRTGFQRILHKFFNFQDKDIDGLFDQIDIDHNGYLDAQEFIEFSREHDTFKEVCTLVSRFTQEANTTANSNDDDDADDGAGSGLLASVRRGESELSAMALDDDGPAPKKPSAAKQKRSSSAPKKGALKKKPSSGAPAPRRGAFS